MLLIRENRQNEQRNEKIFNLKYQFGFDINIAIIAYLLKLFCRVVGLIVSRPLLRRWKSFNYNQTFNFDQKAEIYRKNTCEQTLNSLAQHM